MSGASPDDMDKETILAALNRLKKSAQRNNDVALIMKIDELMDIIYKLETY